MDYSYRPSVDVFFHTVAAWWPVTAVGVLLTGMGADGAKGLLAMRRAGWHTIAQDQATSIVYGMPKAAAKIDAAAEILPLDRDRRSDRPRRRRCPPARKDPPKEPRMTDQIAGRSHAAGRSRAARRAAFAFCWWMTSP